MRNTDTKGKYAEFMVFLLIYASYADYELSTSEITRIKSKYDPQLVDQVLLQYEKMSEFERLNYIMKNKKLHLNSEEDVAAILSEVNAQFNSDGDFSKLEKGLSIFLEHMLAEEWK